ncbi:MAG: AMP-binding protein [Paramuribaculum sp.]|nr:AMP-binding protein [Paramuribaculum sp.]
MKIIGDLNNEVEKFLQQWNDSTDYIEAYTSGSTGTPQRILLPKTDMIASAEATCDFFNLDDNSLLHLPLSIDYIAGKMMVVRALVSGATLWVENPSVTPLTDILYERITLSAIVPAQIPGLIYNINKHGFSRLENLIIGGAPLSIKQENSLLQLSTKSYVTYGMTETCSHVALRRCGMPNYTALPGITFGIDSRQCLTINMPERTIKDITTNDVVDLLAPDSFRWIGRIDNVINTGGIKVFPEKIEAALSPYIPRHFYITSYTSDDWGEEVVAIVEGDEIQLNIPENILKKGEKPKRYIFVNELKRTGTGKIIRERPHIS